MQGCVRVHRQILVVPIQQELGLGVWYLRYVRVWGLGFGVWCLVFGVWCLLFGVWGISGFGVWCLVFGV